MALGWGSRRKALYLMAALIILGLAAVATYLSFFNAPASCFDNKKNGDEIGIDCGGSCSLMCTSEVHAPQVLWSRAVLVTNSTYSAVAYVQNTNASSGTKGAHYSFQLFDRDNALIIERTGVTNLPPVQTIPVVETGIDVGNRVPVRTLFTFTDTPLWYRVPSQFLPSLSIGNESLSFDATKLSATVTNNALSPVQNITAVAVVFDVNDVAIAASKSLIRTLEGKSSQEVVFTWPNPSLHVGHAEITLLPSF